MARQIGRWLLLIGALGLAVLGQYYFARKPDYVYDGLVFYGVAAILFLALLRPARASVTGTRKRSLRFTAEGLARAVPVTAGLLLGLAAVMQLNDQRQSYWPIFWTWLAAAGLYLVGFAPWPSSRAAAGSSAKGQGDKGAGGLHPAPSGLVEFAGSPVAPTPAAPVPAASLSYPAPAAFALAGTARMGSGSRASRRIRWRISARGWEWLAAALIVLVAFALRAWRVNAIPWTVGGDEGSQGLWARAVIDGLVKNMFGLGWLSVPNMSFFFQAGWFRILGDNVVGLRLPWAIVGTLTVLGVYLLVRRLFDRPLALLTAFLLATYHFHIHYSRLGSNQVADPLFVVWALYFLVVGWQSGRGGVPAGGRRWAWAASGILAGLSFYFYAGARQVPVILLAALGYAVLVDRSFWREHKRDLLVMLGGFLVVFGPMALVALQHPDDFNARLNQVGILQSGWLDRAAQATGRSRLSLLADQAQHAFLAFNLYADRVSWYGAAIPLMDFTASIFMVLGAAFSLSRLWPAADQRDVEGNEASGGARPIPSFLSLPGWRYAIFVIWFVVVVGAGGALTENPPSSQRLVSSAVPAVFFVAVALLAVSRALAELLHWSPLDRAALAATLAAALAVVSVRYYFGPYQASWVYGNTNAEIATRIGYYLKDLGPGWQEYFFGAPRMYADFGSTPFIAKDVAINGIDQPLAAPFPAAAQHRLVFVFLPERAGELQWVQQTYPQGVLEQVHRIGQPEGPLLFMAYRVQ